jgi:hypothetical protein
LRGGAGLHNGVWRIVRAASPTRVLVVAAIAVGCAAVSLVEADRASASRALPSMYWGAWLGPNEGHGEAPWDFAGVHRFESMAGKPMSLIQFASPLLDCRQQPCTWLNLPTHEFDRIRAHGAIPFFSWSTASIPLTPHQPAFTSRQVLSGRYDGRIRRIALSAKRWGRPFFLRLNHEMNTTVFPWSYRANGNRKGEFAASWRRVWRIFDRVGARNVTWVWCPHADSSLPTSHLRALYPGDRYVDWTCLDAYNWSGPWRSFDAILGRYYRTITRRIAPSKPMVIGETASVEQGGSKAQWFIDLARSLRRYTKVRAVLYFDFNMGLQDWRVNSSPMSTLAFRQLVSSRRFVPNRFRSLRATPIPPP